MSNLVEVELTLAIYILSVLWGRTGTAVTNHRHATGISHISG